MQWITVATPPFDTVEQIDAMLEHLGDPPEGLEARYVGTTDGELRIVGLWESKEHAERFYADTLGPALARFLGPEPVGTPETVGIEVVRSYVSEPVG